MSVSTVITLGYGTFGSVNKIPTLGYSIGEAVNLVNGPLLFTASLYRPGARRGDVYRGGSQAADVYRPGAKKGALG